MQRSNSLNIGVLGNSGESALMGLLEQLMTAAGAMGVMVARRLESKYMIERVRVVPRILREGDVIEFENAVDLSAAVPIEPTGPGRIFSDYIGFSPLASLYLVPFEATRDENLATVVFSNRELRCPRPTLIALCRMIELTIAMGIDYERQVRSLADQLAILGEQASNDPLTQLLNRRGFLEVLQREASRLSRNPAPMAILLFDLDGLKSVNDLYGHEAGDDYLIKFARTLRDNLRAMDVVGRLGGDEFALLAPQTDRINAEELARRLRRLFDARRLPVSIGVAALEGEKMSLAALLSQADQAMYADKAQRKEAMGTQEKLTIDLTALEGRLQTRV
ncbi:MAG: GGDEF domain-containing protein [Ferrimicrobium sp.]|uniref:GGDEF domain-containing protein n=1 Tax=Ferrimicrobium sp. TaxID=2926050 RepID=UPI00263315E9|nr:GGDEF domain-containing protein [Ferrimicrobium sp.]